MPALPAPNLDPATPGDRAGRRALAIAVRQTASVLHSGMDSRHPARTYCGAYPAGLLPAVGIALLLGACALDPDKIDVKLWHCGIEPLRYDGRFWEVPPPSLDATNAPSRWRGRGTATIVDDDTLVYLDDSGIKLTFVTADGVKPGGCA